MSLPMFVGGVPGGPELIIIFLIAILLFGVPLALVVSYVAVSRIRRGEPVSETDIEEVQEQLAELQAAVDDVRSEVREE